MAKANTTTSSSGPITGRNSGMRSIGDSTHSPANAMATFALRGTDGCLRKRRTVVRQFGRKPASSLSVPGGSRRARNTSTTHDARRIAKAIASQRSQSDTQTPYGAAEQSAQGHRAARVLEAAAVVDVAQVPVGGDAVEVVGAEE